MLRQWHARRRPGNKKESSVKKAILGMTEFAVLMIAAVALLGDSPVRTPQEFPCGDYGYDYGPKNVPLNYQLCIDTTAVPLSIRSIFLASGISLAEMIRSTRLTKAISTTELGSACWELRTPSFVTMPLSCTAGLLWQTSVRDPLSCASHSAACSALLYYPPAPRAVNGT